MLCIPISHLPPSGNLLHYYFCLKWPYQGRIGRNSLITMTKILFVCLGNICRSPLAEAIFKHKIQRLGLAGEFEAHSSGTSDYHIGEPPDERTLRNARKNGVIIDHAGCQLRASDLDEYDYIFAMDTRNHDAILRLSNGENHKARIGLIRDFDSVAKGSDVPDPYFGGEKGFQEVFEMLDRSIENLIATLTKIK